MSADVPLDDSTVLFRALPASLKLSREEKRALSTFARTLALRVAGGRSFTCLITSDGELHRLNRTFLIHDYPTDVLSFPAPNSGGSLGDIAISMDRAQAQALVFGHSRVDELRILMLHGLLHLAGMDHERDFGEMVSAERKWRAYFNLPGTLITRASAPSRVLRPSRSCSKRLHQ